jgi:hypothetical protein
MHTHARTLPTALLLVALLAGAAAARQQGETRPLITVTGQAELRVPPDEVVFDLDVVRLDKDLNAAREQTDQSVRQILELARRYDVPQQNVKTDFITVSMKYNTDLVDDEDEKKLRREFLGYEVTKSVNVRFTDLARFEGFFADVLRAGVSKVNSVTFYTSQLRKFRDEARAAAVRAAREKAVAMTAELGQTIGKAYKIEEDAPRDLSRSNNVGYVAGSYSSDESAAFAPGTITVTARVTVSFILN